MGQTLLMFPQSLLRELQKIGYYLPRALLVLIVSFIPVVNVVAPVLWFLLALTVIVMLFDYVRGATFYGEVLHLTGDIGAKLLIATMAVTPLALAFPLQRHTAMDRAAVRALLTAAFGQPGEAVFVQIATPSRERVEHYVERLFILCRSHFAREEALMQRWGYPEAGQHAGYHNRLLERAEAVRKACAEAPSLESFEACCDELMTFLVDDVVRGDMKMKSFLEEAGLTVQA